MPTLRSLLVVLLVGLGLLSATVAFVVWTLFGWPPRLGWFTLPLLIALPPLTLYWSADRRRRRRLRASAGA